MSLKQENLYIRGRISYHGRNLETDTHAQRRDRRNQKQEIQTDCEIRV
jgi:hypothetical protein